MTQPFDHSFWTRRAFLGRSSLGLGALALQSLLCNQSHADRQTDGNGLPDLPHFAPRVRRVVYLFQAGGPSQFETLDRKPLLNELHGQPLPKSVLGLQRLTGMSGFQAILPMAGSFTKFSKHGACGTEISDLLPHTARLADRICVVRSMQTEAINHDPAITFFCSGSQISGRPSMGAWLAYGLGSETRNLPAFCVLVSKDANRDQPLYSRLWGTGFLPSEHQGVQLRAGKEPVLYLDNPDGISRAARRKQLDLLAALHADQFAHEQDPEIAARTTQAELAFRMQTSVPEVADLTAEPASTFALYGERAREPGTYAANCVLARRLLERGVRFVQLFHQGWDQHGGLPGGITQQCQQTDQASAALVADLQQRGLLDDTLVIWGGEFGRTPFLQGSLADRKRWGRDHHPYAFTVWMAGGGVKPGISYGESDDLAMNVAKDPVHVHDLQATLLHLLGIDHEKLTFKFQGRYFRLTDVHGEVVRAVLA